MTKGTTAQTDPTQKFTSFTNSAGQTFLIHGLSPMLPGQISDSIKAEWLAVKKPLPVVPTYTIMATDAHEEETHEHTEKTILEGTPAEVKKQQAAWKAYTDANNEFQGEYSTRLMKKVFLAVVTPPTDAWREEMEFTGVKLETKGTAAERYQFTQLEVVQSMEDVADLQVSVLRLAGIIDEQGVEAAKASFRSLIRQAVIEAGNAKAPARNLESQPVL